MNEIEIQGFLLELSGAIDAHFNFWMAATFAIVVASHVAGEHFNRAGRIGLVVLYLLACSVFYSLYLTLTGQVGARLSVHEKLAARRQLREASSLHCMTGNC